MQELRLTSTGPGVRSFLILKLRVKTVEVKMEIFTLKCVDEQGYKEGH